MADARRRFTTVLALLVLACNALTASVLHRFPDDALHLSRHVALYSYFSSFVSVLGLVGAIRVSATRVSQRSKVGRGQPILRPALHNLPRHLR